MEKFKYKDEIDRSYGAAGMAIGLIVFDGHDMLTSITIEGDPNQMVKMTPDFYFAGNPGVSAKTAWNQLFKNYNIGVGMLMSNILCRQLVHLSSQVPQDIIDMLHDIASEEGRDSCSLHDDEIDRLFQKDYSYLHRVFSHRGVQAVAHDFATTLQSRRSLSRHDVLEMLETLRML